MDWILQADVSILLFIQEHLRNQGCTIFWKTITFLGDGGWFWLALAALLLIFPKTRKAGFAALLAMGIGALCTNLFLKNLVARPRPYDMVPELIPLVKKLSDYSFPSGHTCASFASAFAYMKFAPKKYGVSAVVLGILIAFSRLYVGVHYPTDVIGGFLIGSLGALASCKLIEVWEQRKGAKS